MFGQKKIFKYLFNLSLFALVLGQLGSISKSGESSIYIFDLAVGFYAIFGLLFLLSKKNLQLPFQYFLFLIFVAFGVSSLIINSDVLSLSFRQFGISLLYAIRFVIYVFSGLVTFNLYKAGYLIKEEIINSVILSGVFVAIAGFVQMVILPDFETLDPALGWDPHKNRLASTFFDPNFAGAYLVMCFTAFISKDLKKLKPYDLLISFVLISAIVLTFSRSTWLMLAFVVMVYGIFKYRWILLISFLLAFSAYYAVPRIQARISGTTDPADSAQFRLISWRNTIDIARNNPVFGVGFNSFRYAQEYYGYLDPDTFEDHSGAGSDSSILFVLATTGIVGLLIYLIAFLNPLYKAYLNFDENTIFMTSIIGGLVLDSQFVNSMFFPQIMFLWMTFFAVQSKTRSHT